MLQICLRRALQLAARGLQCALPVHSWNAVALFQKRIFRGASGSISANWKGGCKNAMPCHIYGAGWDITFNMHLNIYGSFLQVVSTQWEERNEGMAVLWQLRVWVYSHETWRRGEGCVSVCGSVCVCLPVCLLERGSRAAVGSIAAGPSTRNPCCQVSRSVALTSSVERETRTRWVGRGVRTVEGVGMPMARRGKGSWCT